VRGTKRWVIKSNAPDKDSAEKRALNQVDSTLKKELRTAIIEMATNHWSLTLWLESLEWITGNEKICRTSPTTAFVQAVAVTLVLFSTKGGNLWISAIMLLNLNQMLHHIELTAS
jgi:hypothetical protein